jgi:hypothetical protein
MEKAKVEALLWQAIRRVQAEDDALLELQVHEV